jgi:methyl-accepting chemotaxis protein
MVEPTLVPDLVGLLAYLATIGVSYRAYRRTELESKFWTNVGFLGGVGFLWTGVVFLEWSTGASAFYDAFSNAMLAVSLGVLAVGAVGGVNSVEELTRATRRAERERLEAETARDDAETARDDAEQAREDAEAARQEAQALSDHLEQKAREYRRAMDRAAGGDLTVRVDADSRSEVMHEIGENFNEMLAELERTIGEITAFVEDVVAAKETVGEQADTITTSTREVSEAVEKIADGAEQQSRSLDEVVDEMSTLSGTVEEIASSADQTASTVQEAADVGRHGREQAIDEIRTLQTQIDETGAEIRSLNERVTEIEEIVDLIQEIAEQTNMLALNASVEAARAGEAGEGFSVVANEIKDLAEQADEATQDIEGRIVAVREATNSAVDDMNDTTARMDESVETVTDASEALRDLAEHVEDANMGVQQISEATDEQAATTEEVVVQADEISQVSDENTDQATEVTTLTDRQTSAATEVSTAVAQLERRVEELTQQLERFQVGGAGHAGRADRTADEPTRDDGASRPAATDGGA